MRPYAIIILTNLKPRFFDDLDSAKDAVADYTRSGIPIEVYKFNDQTKFYVRQEVKAF